MEDFKKRKLELDEAGGDGDFSSKEELRFLIEPLAKPQLAFQEHGEIEEGAVIYDKVTGKSRGYGFITFKNMESTQQALRAPSKLIDGRLAVCNLACESLSGTSSAPDLSLRKLYIGSLSPEVTSEILLNYFARHGEIEEGSVAYDRDTNESRGFGFVTYKTAEAAKKAIDDLEKTLGGRNIVVKYADSQKGKTGQPPFPAGVAPMAALPMNPGYMQQPGKANVSSRPPINYSYPQTVAPYSALPYPNPPTAPSPYPTQGQIPYPQVSAKKDRHGFLPTQPVGMNNYPYYYPKQ
ncbi:UBP1-associated protein 2C [Glycine soja]